MSTEKNMKMRRKRDASDREYVFRQRKKYCKVNIEMGAQMPSASIRMWLKTDCMRTRKNSIAKLNATWRNHGMRRKGDSNIKKKKLMDSD